MANIYNGPTLQRDSLDSLSTEKKIQNLDRLVGMLLRIFGEIYLVEIYFSLQQVSREEGEETTPTTPTLERESPDFVSLEEDTKSGLYRWNVGVVNMSRYISHKNIYISSR